MSNSTDKNNKEKNKLELKEKNLAYGGSALIEGVMMRGNSRLAFTVKRPDGTFYKEISDKPSLSEKIKFFGWPFIRGVVGFIDNMITSSKVLNKSGEIAFPEESNKKPTFLENLLSWILMILTFLVVIVIFIGVPRMLPEVVNKIIPNIHDFTAKNYPILYNLVSGIIRLTMFFLYVVLISLMPDMKRVFGYHGAEHKTINTYEDHKDLTVENVKAHTRLHPRCGTSFIFIVFLITLFIFPFFDIFLNKTAWFTYIGEQNFFGIEHSGLKIQHIIVMLFHIIVGMPIVSSISYECLKLSAKFQKAWIMKIFIAPGLFFQLFTTRNPDDNMIKVGILSLSMVLGDEAVDTPRHVDDEIAFVKKPNFTVAAMNVLLMPLWFVGL